MFQSECLSERNIIKKPVNKRILKLKKKIADPEVLKATSNIELNGQAKIKELMESLDKLSIIEENYEEQITSYEFNESSNKTTENSTKKDFGSKFSNSLYSSFHLDKELNEFKNEIKYDKDEQITISKFELIIVLKENEILRKKTQYYRTSIQSANKEIKNKLELIRLMIENYEERKSIDGKQMDSMKREINELKELYNKEKCFKENEELKQAFNQLNEKYEKAQGQIDHLKKTIGKTFINNVDQCAILGKEVISLQFQLHKSKSRYNKQERERSFTQNIEKATSEISSQNDSKSCCSGKDQNSPNYYSKYESSSKTNFESYKTVNEDK